VHLNGDIDGRFANDIVQDLRERRASYAPGSCPRATQKDGAPKIAETEEIAGRKPWFLARFRLSR
jgi:hypothetical protein